MVIVRQPTLAWRTATLLPSPSGLAAAEVYRDPISAHLGSSRRDLAGVRLLLDGGEGAEPTAVAEAARLCRDCAEIVPR